MQYFLHARPVIHGRHKHSANTHDGFANHRCDVLCADAGDCLFEFVDQEVRWVLTVEQLAAVRPGRG